MSFSTWSRGSKTQPQKQQAATCGPCEQVKVNSTSSCDCCVVIQMWSKQERIKQTWKTFLIIKVFIYIFVIMYQRHLLFKKQRQMQNFVKIIYKCLQLQPMSTQKLLAESEAFHDQKTQLYLFCHNHRCSIYG